MPLNLIEARTAQGGLLPLSLTNPDLGFKVREVTGLDPVKANIVSSGQALLDTKVFQSAQREQRNIQIKMGAEPDWITTSVGDLREQLYDFFMPKTFVALRLYRDGRPPVDISGYVESFDWPLFTADPSGTISIICMDSDFVDPTPVVLTGSTVSTTLEEHYMYSGSIETGILFTLNVNRVLNEFTLYNSPPDGSLRQFPFVYPLVNADVVQISTTPGNKFVRLTRGGVTSDILFAASPNADWLQFFKGVNDFRAYAAGASVPFTITYTTRYGGL